MPENKIFITRKIPAAGIQLLKNKGYEVEVYQEDSALPYEVLLEKTKQADALITLLSDKIDKNLIESSGRLKIIANYAVGYNNIDTESAKQNNIVVTNTPDILTPATADLTWALILAVTKRVAEGDQFVRQGKFTGWGPELLLGGDITGKTMGIIGAGRIGQAAGRRAAGFEMKILYTSNSPKPDFEKQTGAQKVTLDELLNQSDIITIHCPLTPETHHLLNADNLNKVKKGAYLINTSRGQVVHEEALVKALQSGQLAGAGLDVFEFEPEVHPALFTMPQAVLMPHAGSATFETRSEMAAMCARNIIAVMEGKPPINPVN
jgi:glyoxylate reductase